MNLKLITTWAKKAVKLIIYFFKTKNALSKAIVDKEDKIKLLYQGFEELAESRVESLDNSKVYFILVRKGKEKAVREALEKLEEKFEWTLPATVIITTEEVSDIIKGGKIDEIKEQIEEQTEEKKEQKK